MLALRELLDRLRAERREITGLAARDEALIHVDFLVDPFTARILDVGLQARPRRHRAAAYDVRLDQRPGTVADRGDGLRLLEELPHERDGRAVRPQRVGIGDAA